MDTMVEDDTLTFEDQELVFRHYVLLESVWLNLDYKWLFDDDGNAIATPVILITDKMVTDVGSDERC